MQSFVGGCQADAGCSPDIAGRTFPGDRRRIPARTAPGGRRPSRRRRNDARPHGRIARPNRRVLLRLPPRERSGRGQRHRRRLRRSVRLTHLMVSRACSSAKRSTMRSAVTRAGDHVVRPPWPDPPLPTSTFWWPQGPHGDRGSGRLSAEEAPPFGAVRERSLTGAASWHLYPAAKGKIIWTRPGSGSIGRHQDPDRNNRRFQARGHARAAYSGPLRRAVLAPP
jgi:hypothetical protein